jgi:hypothetical protein
VVPDTDTMEDTMTNTDYQRREITVEDVYGPQEREWAQEEIEECASSARVSVDIEFLRQEGHCAVFEVSGHYTDVGPFMTRWDDQYA